MLHMLALIHLKVPDKLGEGERGDDNGRGAGMYEGGAVRFL